MAFVFEKLDSVEAQKIRYLVRDPVYAFQDRVVIDRERELVFVDLGGTGDQPKARGAYPTYYNLLRKNIPVVFEGYDDLKNVDGVLTVDVEYTKMQIPNTHKNLVGNIQHEIIEATTNYWIGRLKKNVVVNVKFPAVQFY